MAFVHTSSFPQYWLKDEGVIEYGIRLTGYLEARQAYLDNTGEHFWPVVKQYILQNYKEVVHAIDIAFNEFTDYISVYVLLAEHEKTITNIIENLNERFEQQWRIHMVPSLKTIICRQLEESQTYFALALCEYQDLYGKEQMKQTLHVYFNDIKQTQVYPVNNIMPSE
jgi:hypothetical protein